MNVDSELQVLCWFIGIKAMFILSNPIVLMRPGIILCCDLYHILGGKYRQLWSLASPQQISFDSLLYKKIVFKNWKMVSQVTYNILGGNNNPSILILLPLPPPTSNEGSTRNVTRMTYESDDSVLAQISDNHYFRTLE